MAMTGAGLATAVKNAIEAVDPEQVITDSKYLDAMCEAIVTYIQGNGQLVGVTTGSATAQTITTSTSSII